MGDKQPEALKLATLFEFDDDPDSLYRQAAALLRTQHAAIERKDALLRQALEALNLRQWAHPAAYRQAVDAIKQELSQ